MRLVLGGEGPEGDALRAHGQRLGLAPDALLLPGWLDATRKQELLEQASCLALPSYGEGLPLVILEAMAAGKPVVATTVGGIPEVARDGVEGLLVAPGDVDALEEALDRLLSDRGLRTSLGARGRRRVLADYSPERLAARIDTLYGELLTRRSSVPARRRSLRASKGGEACEP